MSVPPSSDSDSDADNTVDNEPENDETILKARGDSRSAPIVIVGAGPAGLTCATYLSRLGYRRITVYESSRFAGGLRYVSQ